MRRYRGKRSSIRLRRTHSDHVRIPPCVRVGARFSRGLKTLALFSKFADDDVIPARCKRRADEVFGPVMRVEGRLGHLKRRLFPPNQY